MPEVTVTLGNAALEALKTIRGDRNETTEQTLGRIIGASAYIAEQTATGAQVVIKGGQSGTVAISSFDLTASADR